MVGKGLLFTYLLRELESQSWKLGGMCGGTLTPRPGHCSLATWRRGGSSRVPLTSPAPARVQQLEKAISDLKFSLIPTGPPWEESAPSLSRCSLERENREDRRPLIINFRTK